MELKVSMQDFEKELLSAEDIRLFYKKHVNRLVKDGMPEADAQSNTLDNIAYVSRDKSHEFHKKLIFYIPEIAPFLRLNEDYKN
ncbi:hypothetical protein HYV49_02495 [Candidatus Pacearchaeota archaeon]|nr:hypothetical protein [Candidatus Pacearchaeota archaeon]